MQRKIARIEHSYDKTEALWESREGELGGTRSALTMPFPVLIS
jgi:hypothetical protein